MDNYKMMTDQTLVGCYMMGCNEAFDCLLERYKDKVFQYILARVHDADLANDLFQDTFVKVILTLRQGRYKETGKFSAWLTRIAHNIVVDHVRKDVEFTLSEEAKDTFWEALPAAEQDNADDYESTLIQATALVDLLPQEQQEVVRMRYFQAYSFKEIAEKTGVSINTSLGRMRYALINLRKIAQERQIAIG